MNGWGFLFYIVFIVMGKNILLGEKSYLTLVKSLMKETTNNQEMKNWGCNLFPANSEEREWCQCSTTKFKEYKSYIVEQIQYVKQLLKYEGYSDIAQKNLLYFDKEIPFFKERRDSFNNMYNLALKDCPKCIDKKSGSIQKFVKQIQEDAIFIEKKDGKDEYTLLNKLNSNYSAISYLLTLHRRKKNLLGQPFDYVFKDYFSNSDYRAQKGLETPFIDFILNFLSGKNEEIEIMKEVFNTIQRTTDIGLETEESAYRFLQQKFGSDNVINYSGNYSFVDLFGIDFIVKGFPDFEEKYLPVQVKTNVKDLGGNSRVCYNVAIAKSGNGWIMELYNGYNKVKGL